MAVTDVSYRTETFGDHLMMQGWASVWRQWSHVPGFVENLTKQTTQAAIVCRTGRHLESLKALGLGRHSRDTARETNGLIIPNNLRDVSWATQSTDSKDRASYWTSFCVVYYSHEHEGNR